MKVQLVVVTLSMSREVRLAGRTGGHEAGSRCLLYECA